MEIHKVKPIHSWRDFLKELGTIVLGIVIAITLEHLVESWNWEREVKDARQAILAEMAANNENFFTFRIAVAPCVERQLREADAILSDLEAGRKTAGLTDYNPPPSSPIRESEWEAERASQVLTHFPRAELSLMSRYYGQLADFRGIAATEGTSWSELVILRRPLTAMASTDLIRLRTRVDEALGMNRLILTFTQRQLRISKQLGVLDKAPDGARVKRFCSMGGLDWLRYRSSQDMR